MKKIIACIAAAFTAASIFAASYTNNTYQKLAREYTVKAEKALDAGEYVLAEEYAAKAKENADLSDQYINHMLAKENAEKNLNLARNRVKYVEGIHGKENYPIAYDAATKSLSQAEGASSLLHLRHGMKCGFLQSFQACRNSFLLHAS